MRQGFVQDEIDRRASARVRTGRIDLLAGHSMPDRVLQRSSPRPAQRRASFEGI